MSSFERKAGRLLVLGKLTHSAGALVLTAAGMAHMPLVPFLFYNIIAAIPKTLFLLAIGWLFGDILAEVNNWLLYASFILLIVAGGVIVNWLKSKQ